VLIVEDWPEIRKAASLVQASISKIACLGNTRKAALTSGEPPSNSRPPAGPLVADHRPPDTELAQRAQADGEPKSASLREVNSMSRVMMKRAICSDVCCAVSRSCRTSSVENWPR
jgi:hypothetical protein